MKSQYAEELRSGQTVKEVFVLSWKSIKDKKDGGVFAVLEFSDRSGTIQGIAWDNVVESVSVLSVGDFVFVVGNVNEYNDRLQIVVNSIKRIDEDEIDPKDFLPCAEEDIDQAFNEINDFRSNIKDVHLKQLLDAFFKDKDLIEKFKLAPAAKRVHHAYIGGLVVHTRNVLKLIDKVNDVYADLNLDLLITAGILHDIGKVYEYTYTRSIDFSTQGRMFGHIVIGYELIADKTKQIPDFPESLRLRLLHMILSHHGEYEWGSPKQPSFLEALILHFLDNLDSKVEIMTSAKKKNKGMEKDWSDYHPFLEREIYLREEN
ncbi:MAG: HD domain-containing protein [bacterium]